ncbi:Gldg family protein [Parasphingorhabdus sp.]|uniref:Gldg family protein n=1 Tax=Parasphingorhabdus sp. TaxID=2709688 RepID=UPI003003225D
MALLTQLSLTQCSAADSPAAPPADRLRVQLMTSLPLVWGEGASMQSVLSGETEPAPVYRYWQQQYDMVAIDSLEKLAEQDPDRLILAQPRAMAPADLADLDAWVGAGGDVIILTDPDLAWPSALPFADPRRPLAGGLLSPLLDHWGVELTGTADAGALVEPVRMDQYSFITRVPGALAPIAGGSRADVRCTFHETGFLAHCSVGKGRAIIVADADFLDAALWPEEARRIPAQSGAIRFMDSLIRGQRQSGEAGE